MNNLIFTKSKARLRFIRANKDKDYNWLFLPGGPGLGSESLADLTDILDLPGAMWHLDLPDDGSNVTSAGGTDFIHWSQALVEAVSEFENVILVGHSSGGMFALATPELEEKLMGLILMDSAPDVGWQKLFFDFVNSHPIMEVEELQQKYLENPSNEVLKKLTIACAPYFSTSKSLDKMISILNSLPFNYKSHIWAEKNFDPTYKAKWIPKEIPTLIFAGNEDHLTPLQLFSQSKEFQRKNIVISEINNASHFPWLENPDQVKQVFAQYCQLLE